MSDHLPVLTLLRQTKLKYRRHLIFESRNLTEKRIKLIKERLIRTDWITLLTKDSCNENYNIITKTLKDVMDDISPVKQVKISGKCRYVEPWMTRGLEISQKKKESLYKKTLMNNSTNLDIENYINYRNTYNKAKQKLKTSYYSQKIVDCKQNTKELWKTINSIICKYKHSGSLISYITIEGVRTYNPHKIANVFGKFYSTLVHP